MFALDRLMVVMPLEHVTVLYESVFNATIRHGEILKLNYSQKVPALLNIKIDYENSEAVIEFTGKILGERYKELIRLTNIKQCIDNINALRIVTVNREEFIHAEVLKCDPTIDVETDDIPALTNTSKILSTTTTSTLHNQSGMVILYYRKMSIPTNARDA